MSSYTANCWKLSLLFKKLLLLLSYYWQMLVTPLLSVNYSPTLTTVLMPSIQLNMREIFIVCVCSFEIWSADWSLTGTYSYYSCCTYFIIENTMLYSISGLDGQQGRNICPDWTLWSEHICPALPLPLNAAISVTLSLMKLLSNCSGERSQQ